MADNEGAKIKISGEGINELKSSMQQMSVAVKNSLDKLSQSLGHVSDQSKKSSQEIVNSNKQIESAFKSMQGSLDSTFSKISNSLGTLKTGFAALLGILAGGKMFGDAVSASTKFAGEVGSLSKVMGISTQEASKYAIALRLIGKDADFLEGISMRLLMQLRQNEDSFKQLGVKVRNANGDLLPLDEIMKNAAKRMLDFKEGADRNLFAMTMFGRAAKESMGIVKLFDDEIDKRAIELMNQFGIQMDKEGVAKAKKYKAAINDLKTVFELIFARIGEGLLGPLTNVAKYLNEVGPVAAKTFVDSLSYIVAASEIAVQAISSLASVLANFFATAYSAYLNSTGFDELKHMGSGFKKLFTLDLSGPDNEDKARLNEIRAKHKAFLEDVSSIWKGTASGIGDEWKGMWDRIKGLVAPTAATLPQYADNDAVTGKGETFPNLNAGGDTTTQGKGSKSSSIVSQWSEELSRMKDLQENWETWSNERELQFWQQKLLATKKGSEEWWGVWHKIAELQRGLTATQKAELDKQAQQELKVMEERTKNALQHEQAMYEMQRADIERRVQLGQISAQEGLRLQKQMLDQEYQNQLEALQRKIELARQDPYMDPAKMEEIYGQMRAITDKYWKDQQKQETQAAMESKRRWDSIASSMSGAVNNMLFSTQSTMEKVKGLIQNLAQHLVDVLIKKIVAGWLAGEATKTAATAAGVGARTAVETAGASEGFMAKIAMNLKTIMADAKAAGAGAYAAVVGIPIIGPILAPVAAVVAFTAVAAFGSGLPSAAGGWDVPEDSLAMVHKDEKILPASVSRKIDAMTGAGGRAAEYHVHFDTKAIDERSVGKFFRNNKSQIIKIIREAHRNFELQPRR